MRYLVATNLKGQIAMYEFNTKKDQDRFMKQAKKRFGDTRVDMRRNVSDI
jgi:hypothetical protein